MPKNVFVGDSNGKAQKVSKIYVGGSDGKAHLVKAAYVGDANGKARKFWPSIILPAQYHQVEYIGANSSTPSEGVEISTGIYQRASNPRIVAVFKVSNISTGQYNASSRFILFDARNTWLASSRNGYNVGLYQVYDRINQRYKSSYKIVFGNCIDDGDVDDVTSSSVLTTESSMESILLDTKYTIDFNNISGSNSRFYLYCEGGYYSLSSHNLLGSISTPSFSYTSSNPEIPYRIWLRTTPRTLVYSFKMTSQSGSLLRNFYPCYKDSDNMVGFYDMVNGVFYSAGYTKDSGKLAVGPDFTGEL